MTLKRFLTLSGIAYIATLNLALIMFLLWHFLPKYNFYMFNYLNQPLELDEIIIKEELKNYKHLVQIITNQYLQIQDSSNQKDTEIKNLLEFYLKDPFIYEVTINNKNGDKILDLNKNLTPQEKSKNININFEIQQTSLSANLLLSKDIFKNNLSDKTILINKDGDYIKSSTTNNTQIKTNNFFEEVKEFSINKDNIFFTNNTYYFWKEVEIGYLIQEKGFWEVYEELIFSTIFFIVFILSSTIIALIFANYLANFINKQLTQAIENSENIKTNIKEFKNLKDTIFKLKNLKQQHDLELANELHKRNEELEKFNKIFVDRELELQKLKKQKVKKDES